MRVAALADVHGNLPALEAVLQEIEREGPDLVVFCGDVASGPMPAETIDLLRSMRATRFVRGNADRGLVDVFDGKPRGDWPGPFVEWCAKQINREQRDFLAGFEDKVELDYVNELGRVLFCHAVPDNDIDVITKETALDRMRDVLAGVDADLVVCGHTHMQFDRMVDQIRVINAGSVGMPYINPGAFWTLLGPNVEFRRTDYDRIAAAERIRATGWPAADEFVSNNVMSVPSEDEVLAYMRAFSLKRARS